MSPRLACATLAVVVTIAQPGHGQPAESASKPRGHDACRPAALVDFCRVGCPYVPPILLHRVEPAVKSLRRPLPRGTAILEVGVNLEGQVVSACVVRGVRSDFDRAAQAAALRSRWRASERKGSERGFVLSVTFCTPDTCRQNPQPDAGFR